MRKLVLVLFLLIPLPVQAGGEWAVLRITSHGCSGTVIYADDQKSLVLTCAHMFLAPPRYDGEPDRIDPNLLARSFTFDAPHPSPGQNPRPGIRLLKYDINVDLALIQVNTRLPYVCPVCTGTCQGPVASVGYDFMQWPAVVRPATVQRVEGARQFTRQRPRSGRSGGPLLSANGTCVIGVCTGYVGPPNNLEVVPGGYGIYSSQAAILKFLGMTPGPAAPLARRPLEPYEIAAGGRPVAPRELPDPNFRGAPAGAPTVGDRRLMPYAGVACPGCPCGPGCPCPPGVCPNCPTVRPGGT